jgi:hypothetical protein
MIACCCRGLGTVFSLHAHVALKRFHYVEVWGVSFHERVVETLTCLQVLPLVLGNMCGHIGLMGGASFSSEGCHVNFLLHRGNWDVGTFMCIRAFP